MLIFLESINDDALRRRFETLYNRYKEPMMLMAQAILHNHHDAEDAVHEVFLNIAMRRIMIIDTITNDRDLKYYLLASVKNTALNMEKRKSRLLPIDEVLDKSTELNDDDFLEMLCQHLEYEELVQMIKSMPSPYKEVVYYHFYLEMKVSEISRLTNRSLTTVKKQISRGKKLLLSQITGRNSNDDKR